MSSLFTETHKEIKAEFPSFKIKIKEGSGLMLFIYRVLFMRFWCPEFMASYVTAFGTTIYMPFHLIGTDVGAYTLRHERIHMRDSKGWKKPFFALSYVLPPAGLTFRAYWEFRAYKETLRTLYERRGKILDQDIDWIAKEFTGSSYLWMFPFPKTARKILNGYRKEIENGH